MVILMKAGFALPPSMMLTFESAEGTSCEEEVLHELQCSSFKMMRNLLSQLKCVEWFFLTGCELWKRGRVSSWSR
jgi:hypothetical protein